MLYKLSELKELKISEYIYCLKFKDKLKIGKSINPYTRARTLRTQSGEEILNIFVIQSDFKLEQLAHQHFAKYRTIGEYFKGLDFNEVCQWLEENRIEVKLKAIKQIDFTDIFKWIFNLNQEPSIQEHFEEIDAFTEDLIDRVPDSPKKEKHIRNIIYLGKNLKEIYVCCIRLCDTSKLKILTIVEQIYNNVLDTYWKIVKTFGWKIANNWVYKFKKSCCAKNINLQKLLIISKLIFTQD